MQEINIGHCPCGMRVSCSFWKQRVKMTKIFKHTLSWWSSTTETKLKSSTKWSCTTSQKINLWRGETLYAPGQCHVPLKNLVTLRHRPWPRLDSLGEQNNLLTFQRKKMAISNGHRAGEQVPFSFLLSQAEVARGFCAVFFPWMKIRWMLGQCIGESVPISFLVNIHQSLKSTRFVYLRFMAA